VSLVILQLPLVLGLGVFMTALHLFFPFCVLAIFAGQEITAGVLSATVIVNEQLAELAPFVAV
jgi:hypothetical protein